MARVIRSAEDDRVWSVARGLAFSATLAIFPAIIAAISLWGLFTDPIRLRMQLAEYLVLAPHGAAELLRTELERIANTSSSSLGIGLLLGLGGALWSTTSGTAALVQGINTAYDERETRTFFQLRWLAVRLTMGLLAFGTLALIALALIPLIVDSSGIGWLADVFRWPVLGVSAVVGLGVVYHYAPNRRRARRPWITPGAVIAVTLWLVASYAFNLYAQMAADFSATYGSIGSVIALMIWFYVTALAILLGAELNAELEAQTTLDSTVGPDRPMGMRGAVKADHVGRAREDLGEGDEGLYYDDPPSEPGGSSTQSL